MRHTPHDKQQPQPPHPQPPQPPQRQPQPLPHRQPPQRQPPHRQPRAYCSPSRGVPAFSLSKTKNVPKLTSAISSSLSVICGRMVLWDGVSAVGTAVAADAPPASDKDATATPTTGTASLRAFRFEACVLCGIIESSRTFELMFE